MIIIIIKILLVIASILSLGMLPLLALLEQWIWNNVIVTIITCAVPITSFWVILGLTAMGFPFFGSVFRIYKKVKE